MSVVPTFELLDGSESPWIIWGNIYKGTKQAKDVIDAGLRGIDTAQIYGTEPETGKLAVDALAAGIDRSKLHITSKLSGGLNDEKVPMDEIRQRIEASVKTLGTIPDLFLIHNPFVVDDVVAAWKVLEEMKDEGKLKSIGVSNFRVDDLEKLIASNPKHLPVVNQIEYHPFLYTHLAPVLELQKKHGILTQSFGSLIPLLRHPGNGGPLRIVCERIAERVSSATGKPVDAVAVLLLWTRAQGIIAVTSSSKPEHIAKLGETARLPDLLTQEEVDEITNVGKQYHFRFYKHHMTKDFSEPDLPNGARFDWGEIAPQWHIHI